jgi:hypothetical protein
MDRTVLFTTLALLLAHPAWATAEEPQPATPFDFAVARLAEEPVSPSGVVQDQAAQDDAVLEAVGDELGICCCPSGYIYFRAEALALSRDNDSRNQTVVEDAFTFAPLATTGEFGFDYEVAPRWTLGRECCDGWGVHGTYFAQENWHDRIVVLGANDLTLPNDIGLATFDFLDADRMQLDYAAELHNAEINVTRDVCGNACVKLLAGFRYLALDEVFNINSTDVDFGTSDYNIRARNDLFGGQLGVLVNRDRCNYGWRFTGKAGIYTNEARQRTFLGDLDNTVVLRDLKVNKTNAAFIGEIGLSAYWQVGCNLRLIGGYSAMWVEGIALGPNQLDFTDTPDSSNFVNTNGGVLFHGANLGIEWVW